MDFFHQQYIYFFYSAPGCWQGGGTSISNSEIYLDYSILGSLYVITEVHIL